MGANKRRGDEAVPNNYKDLLTPEQIDGMRKLESFGWGLLYVRRPKFETVEVIVAHTDGKFHAVLGLSGELEQVSKAPVRGDGDQESPDSDEAQTTTDPELSGAASQTDQDSTVQKEPIPTSGNKSPLKYLV
jgi:hypothetical protein